MSSLACTKMVEACQGIVRDGLKSKIRNGEMDAIRESLDVKENNKFDQLFNAGYAEFVMQIAIEVGSKDVVEILIKEYGVNVDTIINRQSTIHYAISHKQLEIVEFLLKLGANIENLNAGLFTYTPLRFAASCGLDDIVKILIEHGANVNCGFVDYKASGQPPLIEALNGGSAKLMKLFLDLGCSATTLKAALSKACVKGNAGMVNLLLDHPNSINARIIDSDVLLSPAGEGKTEIIKLLIQRGANVNAKGPNNETALLVAAKYNLTNTVRLLLHHGANINDVNSCKSGALLRAAAGGHLDVVACLLKRGADINQIDEKGYTPLLVAAECEVHEMVKLLLDHGADFNAENNSGECIMDIELECLNGAIDYYYIDEYIEFAKFLVMRMVQMRCDKLFVSEKNWLACKRNKKIAKFQRNFEKEMKAMKIARFTDLGICFFDIIKASSNVQFIDLATNEKVKILLESDEFKFCYPICQELISKRFRKSVNERDFMNRLEHFFFTLAERHDDKLPKLARVCIYKIASYLEDEDKKKLSSIFTINRV